MGGVSDRGADVVYDPYGGNPPAPAPAPAPVSVPAPAPVAAPAPAPARPTYSMQDLQRYLSTLQGTPAPSTNPNTGATLSGPNPVITDPFRHMFDQEQAYKYGQRAPKQVMVPVTTQGEDGKPKTTYQTTKLDWWKPYGWPLPTKG